MSSNNFTAVTTAAQVRVTTSDVIDAHASIYDMTFMTTMN